MIEGVKTSIGNKVRRLRKALNLTQKEFAAKIPAKTGGTYEYTYMGKIERAICCRALNTSQT